MTPLVLTPLVCAAPLGVGRVAIAPAITAATFATAGVPLVVTVPARAKLLLVRVLAPKGKALFRDLRRIPRQTKVHTVKFRLHSHKLAGKLRHGRTYVLEIRAGASRKRFGNPKRTTFRVR